MVLVSYGLFWAVLGGFGWFWVVLGEFVQFGRFWAVQVRSGWLGIQWGSEEIGMNHLILEQKIFEIKKRNP